MGTKAIRRAMCLDRVDAVDCKHAPSSLLGYAFGRCRTFRIRIFGVYELLSVASLLS